ncbi:MAG: ATP-binding protein, partial [Muribaculaceae bacterium]|nr:ATP-binding protein [Muribaculaceae bacterium]
LTGQRRVGKSYILAKVAELIAKQKPEANIIYINKEKNRFSEIRDHNDLSEYVEKRIKDDRPNYLLIDEVQDINGFEHTLRSLNADDECQIIVTGSNAKMMSSELATYLAGRYVDIHIYSLSYKEFLEFHKLEDSSSSVEKYLSVGGLPHLARLGLGNEDLIWEYLQNIYNTIVLKDVVQRENLRNITLFENLMNFLSDNTGQLVSATSLSKYLKSKKVALTPLTAINYIKSASNAYILNKVGRYDIHGKKLLENIDKYYFEDLGLRNLLVGSDRTKDIEKVMENAVYLHLKQLGFKISVGLITNGEIDFVAEKKGKTIYFQVAYLLADQSTIDREFSNLSKINDNYPKYLITMDPISHPKDYDGIIHISLRHFLTMDKF